MRIPENIIQQVLETTHIEEVIGEFVILKKRGTNYTANCPFHNERTPSFSVSPTKGIYKCFGCGAAGNVTTFLMEHEHFSFPDAIHWLAKKYHIDIPEQEPTQEERNAQQQEASLYIATQFAAEYFAQQLQQTDEGRNIGLSYLQSRGFTPDIIEKFQLGYSPEDGDLFVNAAQSLNYQPDILQKAGLVVQKNDHSIAFFRRRVQFPIHNLSGKVVAFAGRTLLADKKIPKYINSSETDIYNKRKVLYGMHLAKKSASKHNHCFLVEGYADVIAMHQVGIENVVASSGTSLATEQAKILRRYVESVTILYDGDVAGVNATIKGIDVLLSNDINVHLVLLPETDDPDSFIRTKGATAFKDYIKQNTKDFVLFKTDLIRNQSTIDPNKQAELIHDLITTLSCIGDEVKRYTYIKACSEILDIDKKILTRPRQGKVSISLPKHTKAVESKQIDNCEREILYILIEHGSKPYDASQTIALHIVHELDEIPFKVAIHNNIYGLYKQYVLNYNVLPPIHYFTSNGDADVQNATIDIVTMYDGIELSNRKSLQGTSTPHPSESYLESLHPLLQRFKLCHLSILIEDSRRCIQEASESGEEQLPFLLEIHQKMLEWRAQIANELGCGIIP